VKFNEDTPNWFQGVYSIIIDVDEDDVVEVKSSNGVNLKEGTFLLIRDMSLMFTRGSEQNVTIEYANVVEEPAVEVNDGVVLYYEMEYDENDKLVDKAGGNDGELYEDRSARFVEGLIGDGVGINEGMWEVDVSDVDFTNFSIVFWLKVEEGTCNDKTRMGLDIVDGDRNGAKIYFVTEVDKGFKFGAYGGSTDYIPNEDVCDNKWHMFAYTHDGNVEPKKIKFYFDGQLVGTYYFKIENALTARDTNVIRIGNIPYMNEIVGVMDMFILYNKVINKNEIQYLYNNGNGRLLQVGGWDEYQWQYNPVL